MTKCTATELTFEPVKRRKVTANFNGGDITGNGGLLLLRKIDRLTGLTKQVAWVCLQTVPVATGGGRTSSDCCYRPWPMS